MKKILFAVCILFSFFISAQEEQNQDDNEVLTVPKKSFWDNVRFGGGIGLGFGSNSTTINISPSAIYDFENGFALGVSVGYLYSKVEDFKSNVISPGIVALYNPALQVQLSVEFEQLYVSSNFSSNFDYPALYLGVAYRTGWAALGVRYDVLYDINDNIFASPWSPIIRIYF